MKEGGTVLGGQGEPPDSSSGAFEDIKPRFACREQYVRSIFEWQPGVRKHQTQVLRNVNRTRALETTDEVLQQAVPQK